MEKPDSMEQAKSLILQAALPHVAFDGWSAATLAAAITESGTAPGLAHALFPRGGIDLALAYHHHGDRAMRDALADNDLTALRFRDRIATAVRLRLENADRDIVRRGSTLFSLPQNAAEGARAIWGTADAIWVALGDNSNDINWYTKRATLSAVYASTVLFWLGDDTPAHSATWDFLNRRIENVMSFEGAKARFRENPLGKALLNGPLKVLERVHAPQRPENLPGRSHR
jgi:ubiquinone biosynthesis protein COQ9